LLPLCLFKKTRPWAGIGFYFSSYLFGACLWAFSCIVVINIWGYGALAVGLLFAGVGVVPVALLATLIHAEWPWFLNLIISIILTFGARWLGAWLATASEDRMVLEDDSVIDM
jgi:hypothetical protein